jgi:hypothetical protein
MSTPIDVKQNPDGSWTAKGGTSLTVVSVTAVTEHKAVAGHAVAMSAIKAQGKGWIKCSEHMPELPKGGGKAWVIAYTPARKAQSAFNGARFLYWNGIDWRYGDGSRFEHRVTHWQPLPTPPTE